MARRASFLPLARKVLAAFRPALSSVLGRRNFSLDLVTRAACPSPPGALLDLRPNESKAGCTQQTNYSHPTNPPRLSIAFAAV